MWLYERDSGAPSVSSEPGGKQSQHHIRGERKQRMVIFIEFGVCHPWYYANLFKSLYGTLTHWRIYASLRQTIIGSDNGFSPDRRQAFICTNAGILLINW